VSNVKIAKKSKGFNSSRSRIMKRFMGERDRYPENRTEQKEYGFDDGLQKIMEKINELLSSQDYVVVAVAGPSMRDTDVGKTFISGRIGRECSNLKLPVVVTSDEKSLPNVAEFVLNKSHHMVPSSKGIFILGAMGHANSFGDNERVARFKKLQGQRVRQAGDSIGLTLARVDIRVLIYRPDRPIQEGDDVWADIIIRNEQAVDKERTKI
jgi:hypothetical protein